MVLCIQFISLIHFCGSNNGLVSRPSLLSSQPHPLAVSRLHVTRSAKLWFHHFGTFKLEALQGVEPCSYGLKAAVIPRRP